MRIIFPLLGFVLARPAAAAPTITTTSLPTGQIGVNYSQTLQASGGLPPYSWSISSGALPPGLALTGAQISGKPTAAGTANFTVKVTDLLGSGASQGLSIVIVPNLTIQSCPAATGVVGQSYSSTLAALGGVPPYTWKINSGALPAGLALNSANATIAGIPSQPGVSNFTLQINDSSNQSATLACAIRVNPPALMITSAATLPGGTVGVSYTVTLTAAGGQSPYTWSANTLPPGFFLQSSTGVLSGVPSNAGTFTFTLQIKDQAGATAQQNVTLTVASAPSPGSPVISVNGLPASANPAQQIAFGVQMGAAYPSPLSGTLTLSFTPDPSAGIDDPAIQFASGGRTISFTVAANSTTVSLGGALTALQTGTVAGTIQITLAVEANGGDVTPAAARNQSIAIARAAPAIMKMAIAQTSSGFTVTVVGYSDTRDVAQGTFGFSFPSGSPAGSPISLAVPLSAAGSTWFGSTGSRQYGGQFSLIQAFNWQGGVPSGGLSGTTVSATLTNSQGTSGSVSAKLN